MIRLPRWPSRLAAPLVLAAACACPGLASAQPAAPVTLRIQDMRPGAGNLLMRVARSKGFCEREGLVCELQPIATSPLGMQSLIAGSTDVAIVGSSTLVNAVARGAKVKAALGFDAANVVLVAARAELAPPGTPGYPDAIRRLKGRKVGVAARSGGTEFLMNHLLRAVGLQPDDVTYVGLGNPQAAHAALVNGQVDAIVSWEPAGLMCRVTGRCTVVWNGITATEPADLRAMHGFNVTMAMRAGDLQARPGVARALVRAAQAAEAFVNDPANLDELERIVREYDPIDSPERARMARQLLEQAVRGGNVRTAIDRRAVKAALAFVAGTEPLPREPAADELIWAEAP